MLGIVGEDGHGCARGRGHGQQREAGINGPGRSDGIRAHMARMHVGADRRLAEGIGDEAVGAPDPAAVEGVVPVVGGGPPDAGGRQFAMRLDDGFGDARRQRCGVCRIHATPEAAHGGWGRMRVGGGDHHPVGRDAGGLGRDLLGLVDQVTRHHAGVDNAKGNPLVAVVEDEGLGGEGIDDAVGGPFGEHGVHADGKPEGRDVGDMGAGAEHRPGCERRQAGGEDQQDGKPPSPHRGGHAAERATLRTA